MVDYKELFFKLLREYLRLSDFVGKKSDMIYENFLIDLQNQDSSCEDIKRCMSCKEDKKNPFFYNI